MSSSYNDYEKYYVRPSIRGVIIAVVVTIAISAFLYNSRNFIIQDLFNTDIKKIDFFTIFTSYKVILAAGLFTIFQSLRYIYYAYPRKPEITLSSEGILHVGYPFFKWEQLRYISNKDVVNDQTIIFVYNKNPETTVIEDLSNMNTDIATLKEKIAYFNRYNKYFDFVEEKPSFLNKVFKKLFNF